MDNDTDMIICPNCSSSLEKNEELSSSNDCPVNETDFAVLDEASKTIEYPFNQAKSDSKSQARKTIGILAIILAVIFAFTSYKTRFSGYYDYYSKLVKNYEDNIEYYISMMQDNRNEAKKYSAGLFKNGYNDVANGYQKLINETEDDINKIEEMQIKIIERTILYLVISIILAIIGVWLLHNRKL